MLDKLERLLQAATPRPWTVRPNRVYSNQFNLVGPPRGKHHQFVLRPDAELSAGAVNTLPALLRVARAAERFAGMGLACEYTGEEPEPGGPDECPGIAEVGGPCHWCELRAALAALEGGEK